LVKCGNPFLINGFKIKLTSQLKHYTLRVYEIHN